jgi:RNA recognition motif-containing protein
VLVPLFEEYGRIYELRLMLDFNGTHRGFAYVKFCETGSARAAAAGLDRHQVCFFLTFFLSYSLKSYWNNFSIN